MKVEITPLSVNKCWQGKRYKTNDYKRYERDLLLLLPKVPFPTKDIKLTLKFGFKNKASDIDNPVKMILDILQKKYGFNDKEIIELHIYKEITKTPFIEITY
ncbi:MAG: RusA family crossover junction endodeoxyribonuclease [Bacteroidales bacterium]|jgi:Holliday junction resolvase RusA-like endonuclease